VGRYRCEVLLARSDRTDEWVNARSVLSVLSLAASQGTRLRVRATGADCQEALEAVGSFLEEADEAATGI
jgi:phosphotransferase system HPr (HPr) family protein